eukprot:scaffold37417_cov31-Tisochrysis_lutea.AAC.5
MADWLAHPSRASPVRWGAGGRGAALRESCQLTTCRLSTRTRWHQRAARAHGSNASKCRRRWVARARGPERGVRESGTEKGGRGKRLDASR